MRWIRLKDDEYEIIWKEAPQWVVFSFKVILPILLFLFGGAILLKAFDEMSSQSRSLKWPQAQGQVVYSALGRNDDADGRDLFCPVIRYAFSVDGSLYYGERIHFDGPCFYSPAKARASLRDYPVGKGLRVYYDPDNPWKSVLVPGSYQDDWIIMKVGFGLVFMVLPFFVPGIIKRQAEDQKIPDYPLIGPR